jgi:hypothetical protein
MTATMDPRDLWNLDERSETRTQRLDRNWACLLQELRVVLTGVQLLTGFLLTLPFQQRFTLLDAEMRHLYVATVACSIAAALLLTAPVALHRLVFRRHLLERLVTASHLLTMIGLLLLAAAMSEVATMLFDVMLGRSAAIGAAICSAVVWLTLWVALPMLWRRGTTADVLRD